jgi:hypothetical protein
MLGENRRNIVLDKIARERQERGRAMIDNNICFGAYDGADEMVYRSDVQLILVEQLNGLGLQRRNGL